MRRLLIAGLGLAILGGCQSLPNVDGGRVPELVTIEDGSPERAAMNARVYDAAIAMVTARFYDRTFNNIDFEAAAAAHRAQALAAPDEATFYRELNALLGRLDDSHTVAQSPQSFIAAQRRILTETPDMGFGVLEGSSSSPDSAEKVVHVVAFVRPDSPAAEAGVQRGWRIETLNGEPWANATNSPEGQEDVLRFLDRNGTVREVRFVTRKMPRPIGFAERREDGVLILQFFAFDEVTDDWLQAQLAEARANPPKAVVLDISANDGGLLTSAGRMIGAFLPERRVFARTNFGLLRGVRHHTHRPREVWSGPLAVIVGQTSYSSAEVFAAAIQDQRRGPVVGQQSAGAVVASRAFTLPDGGLIRVGFSELRTAEGRVLEKVGVTPDRIVVPDFHDVIAGRNVFADAAVEALFGSHADEVSVAEAGLETP